MPPFLRLFGAIGSSIALIGAALLFVSQAPAVVVLATPASTRQTHYAWGLVMGDGFGNQWNQMLNTWQEFNGQLYAGTTNPLGAEIWRSSDGLSWTPAITDGFAPMLSAHVLDLAVLHDQLYAATLMNGLGGLIWRSSNGNDWKLIVPPNGLGQGEYQAFAAMTTFSDSLYVANVANDYRYQALWKTTDGLTWQPVTVTGLMTAQLTAMIVFSDHLYAATRDITAGVTLWQTDGLTWGAVITNGFGVTQNLAIAGLGIFNDWLYAVTENQATNLQIWRSANGLSWTPVVVGGLGNPPHNTGRGAKLIAFNGDFFVFTGSLMRDNEVYRSNNGEDWELIPFEAWNVTRHNSLQDPAAVFSGRMLIGIGNVTTTTGCQIWSYLATVVYLPIVNRKR